MECGKWSEEDWKTLIYTIKQGNCILMLGPDASAEKIDGQWRPLTAQLAQELFDALEPELQAYIDPANLPQAAQYYLLSKKRNALNAKVDAFYAAKRQVQNELYPNLAALPFYLTLTSTPDIKFFEALQNAAKDPVLDRYHFRGENRMMVHDGTVQSPLVFHLYGVVTEPDSLVLTELDLIDFLAAVIAKNPPLPHNILSRLRDPNKSLLFLGFGFKHWYLRILLHVLQGREKESGSFALEQCLPKNLAEFQETILFFSRSRYNIQICQQELLGFAAELRQRYEKSVTTQGMSMPMPSGPTIFICHAPENTEQAINLYQHLATGGFRAWQGANDQTVSDETLERALTAEIDYVVVVQSHALRQQFEGSFDEKRLRQEQAELKEKWDLLSQKLSKIERAKILETNPANQFALDDQITSIQTERQQVGQQLSAVERKLTPAPGEQIFKKVLRFALERQKSVKPGTTFIILVQIEAGPLFEELKQIPTIDLSQKENVKDLISTIKRDQERRKRR